MSDDLNKKVQQVAQLLGQNDLPDGVKELIALLVSSLGNKEENKNQAYQRNASVKEAQATGQDTRAGQDARASQDARAPQDTRECREAQAIREAPAISSDVLDTARKALERFNSANDPRINLLQAIKPFMNKRRQQKIGNCIQLLKVAGLSKMLGELEK